MPSPKSNKSNQEEKPIIGADVAEKLLRADLANIARKLKAGKTLTETEKKRLEQAKQVEPSVPQYAKNYVELAKILGVDRRTLQSWRKEEDSPKAKTSNGKHDVEAWLAFQKKHGKKGGEPQEEPSDLPSEPLLKRKKLALFCQEKEMQLAVRRGELIEVALVREEWSKRCAAANSLLRKRLENELPSDLEGAEAADIYEALVAVVDEFNAIMSGATEKEG